MPKSIKDLLVTLGEKAGLKDNQEFQLAISASTLSEIELPDNMANSLSSLMNETSAIEFGKTNLAVKTHHIGAFSDGFLTSVREKAKEFGLSHEQLAEFDSTKNTGDKIKLVMDGLNGLIEKAKTEGGKGKSDEYVRQVTELQTKIQNLEAESQRKINETQAQYRARMEKLALSSKMAFAWNKEIPEIAREAIYHSAISKELDEMGGKLIFDDEKNDFRIVQKADESLPLIKDAKPFEFMDLHSLTLQKHKLLNIGSEPGGNGNPNPAPFAQPGPLPGNGTTKTPAYAQKSINESLQILAEMQKNQ